MGAPVSCLRRWAPAIWSMWAWVMMICLTVRECLARRARMRGMSSPGSTTMASREVSSPRMEQLHWRGPTGMVSRIMIFSGLGLLEVVDAVVFGLGDTEEGAVAEFGGEGDLVCDVGPGLEV